jgi:hypothetical protein
MNMLTIVYESADDVSLWRRNWSKQNFVDYAISCYACAVLSFFVSPRSCHAPGWDSTLWKAALCLRNLFRSEDEGRYNLEHWQDVRTLHPAVHGERQTRRLTADWFFLDGEQHAHESAGLVAQRAVVKTDGVGRVSEIIWVDEGSQLQCRGRRPWIYNWGLGTSPYCAGQRHVPNICVAWSVMQSKATHAAE